MSSLIFGVVNGYVKNAQKNKFNSDKLSEDNNSDANFDLWHDRAVFHFLTKIDEINKYVNICEKHINKNGYLIIGTFSENGPVKCSGLEISRYSVKNLQSLFCNSFELVDQLNTNHTTPFETIQNFNKIKGKLNVNLKSIQEVEELETLGYKVKATNNNTFIYWK